MQIRTGFTVLVIASIASAALAAPARAFDLTGTWEGKWSCQVFDGESFKSSEKESAMAISQTGSTMAIEIDGDFYTGLAIADDDKPRKGSVVIAHCGLTNVPGDVQGELMDAEVKTEEGEIKASFKASSVAMDGQPSVARCTYNYKRTGAIDPSVAGCP